jgi:hypothetical protein
VAGFFFGPEAASVTLKDDGVLHQSVDGNAGHLVLMTWSHWEKTRLELNITLPPLVALGQEG